MALHNAPRPLDPAAAVALERPAEDLGGWLQLLMSSAIVLAILAVFYSPLGPLDKPDVFTGTYSEVAR